MRIRARISAVGLAWAVVAASACGGAAANNPNIQPQATTRAAQPTGLKGDYTCSISGAGKSDHGATCRIEAGDVPGSLWLEKVDGQPRISGEVTPKPDGFHFSGDYYCPRGACDDEVDATFERLGAGAYRATLSTKRGQVEVALHRKPVGGR